MKFLLSRRIACTFLLFFSLVFLPKGTVADQLICNLSNKDIQVAVSQENRNTVSVVTKNISEGIENITLHLTDKKLDQIDHVVDEAGNDYEINQLEVQMTPSQKLKIVFKEEIPADFIESVSYIKEDQVFEIKTVPQDESSDSETVESTFTSDTTEKSKGTEHSTTEESETENSSQLSNTETEESTMAQTKSTRSLGGGSAIIPEGGILINGLFGTPAGGSGFSIKNIDPDDSINNGQPYSEITIGGKNNWVSMWSLENNLLDFSHSFKGRMYVNFGGSQTDGFTFTMHNDPAKTKAITSAQNNKTDGQNLGVYGANVASRYSYPSTDAVKNSFTVEFDMYQNGADRYPSAFDVDPYNIFGDIMAPHMAYTFPGNLTKTYQAIDRSLTGRISDVDYWYTMLGGGKAARIKHQQLAYLNASVADNVQDSKWYEFNFSFDESTKDFQYYLRNPVTGNQTAAAHVPWSDLSTELKLSANNMSAYWGFTVANGASAGNVKVVFAEAPVELAYDLSNHIFNAEGTDITVPFEETSKEVFAKKGDVVQLETDIKLSQIDYTSSFPIYQGNIDPALFDLSTTSKTKLMVNGVYRGDLIPTINQSTGQFSLLLPVEVKKDDTINLTTTVKSKINSTSDDKTYLFSIMLLTNPTNGATDYLASDPGYFWLNYVASPLNISWSKDEMISDLNQSSDRVALKESGYDLKFYYDGGMANSTIDYVLKKQDQSILASNVQNDEDPNSKKELGLTIPLSAIDYGSNEFILEVSERGSVAETQSLKCTLDITGSLQLVAAPPSLKWTDRTIGTSKGVSARDPDNVIDLAVQDSRKGTPDDWYVSINTVKSNISPGFSKVSLIWKDLKGVTAEIPDAADASSLKIMDKNNTTTQSNYMNKLHLESDQGVLLDSEEYLPIGDYDEMKVQWLLQQTYQPD